MKNFIYKYNPFYVFLGYWDFQEDKLVLARLNILQWFYIYITCFSAYKKKQVKYIPRKYIILKK